jgi:hypothetical protein
VYEAIALHKTNSEFLSARLGTAFGEPLCKSGTSNVWRNYDTRVSLWCLWCRRCRRRRRRLGERAHELNAQQKAGDDGYLKGAHKSSPSLDITA